MSGEHTTYRTCTLCEATCGIEVRTRIVGGQRRVVSIRGDREDVFSRGHICPKATGMGELHHDPDRLKRPLRKRPDGRFEEIGWDEAYDLAAEGLASVRERGGADALALYRGNPTIHDLASVVYWNVLQQVYATRNRFSAGSLDTWPRYVQVATMFGGMLHIPVPDIDRSDHMIVIGANPIVSNGSLMTAPDVRGRLAALRRRGGKLVVIDPRRSETAERADEHHFIEPGADAALLLSMVHVLFDEDLVDLGRCAGFAIGLERVAEVVAPFSPERVAEACAIPAAEIRRLVREFAAAPRAVIYGRMGTCIQAFGTLSCWAIEVMNTLTGNLDREGGAMFSRPAASLDFAVSLPGGATLGRYQSRVSGHDEIFGELPVAALAEEIETPGEGQVRGLLTMAGNPVLTAPNSNRLEAALESLDFMVAIDFYLNETTRHADLILPPTAGLENESYDLALYHLAVRNVAHFSPRAIEPGPDTRSVWEIVLEIAKRGMGLRELSNGQMDDLVLQQLTTRALAGTPYEGQVEPAAIVEALGKEAGPRRVLDLLLRLGPYGRGFDTEGRAAAEGLCLAEVEAHPHGLDLGALEPALPGKLATASGSLELAPERILADVPRLASWLADRAEARGTTDTFRLVTRRDARSMNSWLHNLPGLMTGRPRFTLEMNPDDARELKLRDGDRARLESRVGSIEAPIEISARMKRGVVSLPHGWGHDHPDVALRVARAHGGANANRLSDDALLDVPSGASALNGFPVRISLAP